MKVSEAAKVWQAAGVSTIPILDNQTKRPAIKWSPYQGTIPTLGEVDEWWGNGKPYGLALICGAVSGNLEMVEIEGRAMDTVSMTEVINRMDEMGAGHIWDRLNGPEGYSEMSPSGGLHLLYRISDHEVPGNTKIAQDILRTDEDGNSTRLCLAETRGHGGYVIVAPTPGICHPSGESWDIINGEYGVLPLITWAERNLIHEALRVALDKTPEPAPQFPVALPTFSGSGLSATGLSPGDDFEDSTDWNEILEPHGWHLESRHGPERHWTRPGKDRRDGASATTGRASDRDRLYVFSTSTVFQAEVPYTKFGAYALLNHGGDHSAAARELVRLGFGERTTVATLDGLPIPREDPDGRGLSEKVYSLDEAGNAMRLWDTVTDQYHWVYESKMYYRWDGRVWSEDRSGHLVRDMIRMTDQQLASDVEAERKWGKSSRSNSRITASAALMRSMLGCTKSFGDFNPDRHLLNVTNGILNLRTGELVPHQPQYLMTRTFGAAYDPSATCDRFQSFMESALPDPAMRAYVQRALGYSLLGDVDQRSIFWIYGPPGTGKSTLMDTMRYVFGDYGLTAAAGAFRQKGKDNSPSNDLHSLRGKRFVTTSETAESTSFDEDLLKRLSGRDQVSSRALYQEFQEWTPECALWMATNNAPKFNSDDDAIWRRTKLIPFLTTFTGENQIPDMARTVLAPERDGILNWLLRGLIDYQENGLGEPEAIHEMASEQRVQSDSVARFLDDKITDGMLLVGTGEQVRTSELFAMYAEWARQMGERSLGNRRFNNRVTSNHPELEVVKLSGYPHWRGLGRNRHVGVLGTIPHLLSD